MKPLNITKKQFLWWVIASTVGFALWLAPGDLLWSIGCGILAFSQFIIMTPTERAQRVPTTGFLAVIGILLLCVAATFAGRELFSERISWAVVRVIRHPALVVPFWALGVWLVYRRWRRTETNERHSA